MNCDHCGKPVNLNAKFCGKCGAFLNFTKKIQAQNTAETTATPEVEVTQEPLELVSTQLEHALFEQEHPHVESVEHPPMEESAHGDAHTDGHEHLVPETTQEGSHEQHEQHGQHEQHEQQEQQETPTPVTHPEVESVMESIPEPETKVEAEPLVIHENVEHVEHVEHVSADSAPVVASIHPTPDPVMQEPVNIEQLAPVLNNPIPVLNAEFGANLEALLVAIDGMRTEMEAKIADIKGDVHATAQALAQRIHATQNNSEPVDVQGLTAGIDQLRGEMSMQFGELKAFWATSSQTLVNKNSDDMQAILSAEFKKIQTGIVNLYNTQQNNVVKSTAAFDEVVAALTFKIQNIENFVNGQLASQAQAQSASQVANRSMTNAVNEIKAQLQAQQELLSGLTIDPALIKTMNSFNINFRKQQEQMAVAAQAESKTSASTKSVESSSISDTVVMWFVGFLCGLTVLLGGFSIYNYSSAQDVRAELHKRKVEESLKLQDKSEKEERSDKEVKKSESEESPKAVAKEESKSASEAEPADKSKEGEKERVEKSDKPEKGSERTKEKGSSKTSEREKGEEKAAEKPASKKHSSNEKE